MFLKERKLEVTKSGGKKRDEDHWGKRRNNKTNVRKSEKGIMLVESPKI